MVNNYSPESERKFADHLITLGYPEESIIYEPALHTVDGKIKYRPDFAIIDPQKKEYLAIIDIKNEKFFSTDKAKEQFNYYKNLLKKEKILFFFVSPNEIPNAINPYYLYFFDESGRLVKSDFSFFPTFKTLIVEDAAVRKNEVRKNKSDALERFQMLCWLLSAILLIIVASDVACAYFGFTLLNTERMALLGAGAAFIILPYSQKFKALGIEWEMLIIQDKKANED